MSEICRVSCQNKFVKLVQLLGFIIKEICNDAQSHERKVNQNKTQITNDRSKNYIKVGASCTVGECGEF